MTVEEIVPEGVRKPNRVRKAVAAASKPRKSKFEPIVGKNLPDADIQELVHDWIINLNHERLTFLREFITFLQTGSPFSTGYRKIIRFISADLRRLPEKVRLPK